MVVADELFRMLPGANEGKLSEARPRPPPLSVLIGHAASLTPY